MEGLKPLWQAWSIRLDHLSFRERVLVFLAVVGAASSLMFVGLIEPALIRQEQMLQSTAALQQEILGLRQQLAAIEQSSQGGIDSEIERLRTEADALARQVKAREDHMISPARMLYVLRALINARPGLSLVELTTEPGRPVWPTTDDEPAQPGAEAGKPAPDAAQPAATPAYYEHAVTLRVEGSYALLTDYVERLEGLPWTIRWESIRLDASRHPRLELTLRLYTLSREPEWARL